MNRFITASRWSKQLPRTWSSCPCWGSVRTARLVIMFHEFQPREGSCLLNDAEVWLYDAIRIGYTSQETPDTRNDTFCFVCWWRVRRKIGVIVSASWVLKRYLRYLWHGEATGACFEDCCCSFRAEYACLGRAVNDLEVAMDIRWYQRLSMDTFSCNTLYIYIHVCVFLQNHHVLSRHPTSWPNICFCWPLDRKLPQTETSCFT